MPKPNDNSTLAEIKIYIKYHKLNKPELALSQPRAKLVAGLKKHGHWDSSVAKEKKTRVRKGKKPLSKDQKDFLDGIEEPKRKRGRPKGSKNKKGTKPKKLGKGQKDFLAGIDEGKY